MKRGDLPTDAGRPESDSLSIPRMALYVHIPFCETKCPYCDFNTYAKIEPLILGYVSALIAEIEIWGSMLGKPLVHTVFFGGGTPSYIPAECIALLTAAIKRSFALEDGAEITLEANPGDCTAAKLASYRCIGINRMSIGMQSFDDALLGLLGRRHSAAEAVSAYRTAQGAGFDNISIDLMYGLPHQTLDSWRQTLAQVANLRPPHVSLYALTLEGGTPMERSVAIGTLPAPNPDLAADMYEMAEEELGAAGYRHYEISNWAMEGRQSLHNLVYWRNEPYLGVGPGAHSYLGGHRFSNLKPPREYVKRLENHGAPTTATGARGDGLAAAAVRSSPVVDFVEVIDSRTEMAETMMLGLRLDDGVSIRGFESRFGESPLTVYEEEIDEVVLAGLVEMIDGRIRLTARGRFLSNEVFVRLLR